MASVTERGAVTWPRRQARAGIERARQWIVCWLLVALGSLTSGCVLIAGERSAMEGTTIRSEFVSAEGTSERQSQITSGPASLQVALLVEAESGLLRVEVLQPDGSVALALDAPAAGAGAALVRGSVRTDQAGMLRWRMHAEGARNGRIEIVYAPGAP